MNLSLREYVFVNTRTTAVGMGTVTFASSLARPVFRTICPNPLQPRASLLARQDSESGRRQQLRQLGLAAHFIVLGDAPFIYIGSTFECSD
jgi:hypothetical protein